MSSPSPALSSTPCIPDKSVGNVESSEGTFGRGHEFRAANGVPSKKPETSVAGRGQPNIIVHEQACQIEQIN